MVAAAKVIRDFGGPGLMLPGELGTVCSLEGLDICDQFGFVSKRFGFPELIVVASAQFRGSNPLVAFPVHAPDLVEDMRYSAFNV